MVEVEAPPGGEGNPEVFESEWQEALAGDTERWLSYPAANPRTQAELVERVKAEQVDAILARAGIRRGRVLEYGCGSAGMAVYLRKRGFDVVALDLSATALLLARHNGARHGVDDLKLAAGDVFALPFAEGTFDVVMSYGLLEHFTEPALKRLLAETNRVLKPGGVHVADIVHGRISVRTAANYVNFAGAAGARLLTRRPLEVGSLFRAYVRNYFENKLGPKEYRRLLRESGLRGARVQTCRPFPLLALGGTADRAYTGLLRRMLPLWRWYDRSDVPGLNALGWMYLAYGRKARD